MINKPVNAPNMDATHRGKVNEQHQNVTELVMHKYTTTLSTTH
jgi:hypothetical protein